MHLIVDQVIRGFESHLPRQTIALPILWLFTSLVTVPCLSRKCYAGSIPVSHSILGEVSLKTSDALIDFTHNLGTGALSQLLSHGINQVPVQLLRWDHAGGKVLESLDKRRGAEIKMFTLAE